MTKRQKILINHKFSKCFYAPSLVSLNRNFHLNLLSTCDASWEQQKNFMAKQVMKPFNLENESNETVSERICIQVWSSIMFYWKKKHFWNQGWNKMCAAVCLWLTHTWKRAERVLQAERRIRASNSERKH